MSKKLPKNYSSWLIWFQYATMQVNVFVSMAKDSTSSIASLGTSKFANMRR